MKQLFYVFFLILLSACQEKKLGIPAKVETTPGITAIYQIDKSNSISNWVINKQKFKIPISGGRFSILEGVITTGDIEMDILGLTAMNSSNNSDITMANTLKDTTYFDTKISTVGRFVITKIEHKNNNAAITHLLSGDLTLRNISKTIQIPVRIQMNEQEIMLNSDPIIITPLEWGVLPKEKNTTWTMSLALKAHKELN